MSDASKSSVTESLGSTNKAAMREPSPYPQNSGSDVTTPEASTPEVEKAEPKPDPQSPAMASGAPDGGLVAWLQVAGGFSLFFNSWGVTNSFGVFQSYYEVNLLTSQSSSNISWIGSIQSFLLLIVGVAVGPLFDRGYFYHLIWAGSFLTCFGMMMTSISTQYYQVMLAQGVCVGLGSGCLFIPSVAVLATYFSKKKAFAVGIAASGSSLGGIVLPVAFQYTVGKVGFGWATRIIGFIQLATLAVPLAVMKPRVNPIKKPFFDDHAFKELPFIFFCAGLLFGFMGLYIPFFYISSYTLSNGIANADLSFWLLIILNAASFFGRIVPNFLADKTGPFNMVIMCSAVAALLAFVWIGIKNFAGLVVFSVLYGFFSGSFVSLPSATVASISPNLNVIGTRMGMSFPFAGLGLLVGNPVGGAILGTNDWVGIQVWCGATTTLAVLTMLAARVSKVGWGLMAVA